MITSNHGVQKEAYMLEKLFWAINQIDRELKSIIKFVTIEFVGYYGRCLIFVLEGLEGRWFGKVG
jgi:hypothetical protein